MQGLLGCWSCSRQCDICDLTFLTIRGELNIPSRDCTAAVTAKPLALQCCGR